MAPNFVYLPLRWLYLISWNQSRCPMCITIDEIKTWLTSICLLMAKPLLSSHLYSYSSENTGKSLLVRTGYHKYSPHTIKPYAVWHKDFCSTLYIRWIFVPSKYLPIPKYCQWLTEFCGNACFKCRKVYFGMVNDSDKNKSRIFAISWHFFFTLNFRTLDPDFWTPEKLFYIGSEKIPYTKKSVSKQQSAMFARNTYSMYRRISCPIVFE